MRTRILPLITLLLLLPAAFAAAGKGGYIQPGPVRMDAARERWAARTLRKLTVEEKVGQIFMVWVRARFLNVGSAEYIQLRDNIRNFRVGSFAMTVRAEGSILYKTEPYEAAVLLNHLQQDSPLPLMIAADFESGVSTRLNGSTVFPQAMAFGAAASTANAEAFGRITAQEARAVGVHWNFFPVADVNSNPANPIINTRSFGEDPNQVGELVAAYIRGAHAGGMLTTVKHFPGHGDTATDSHLGVAKVTGDLDRLEKVELPPFRKAIQAGVDSVMVAHLSVPALEPDTERVATTSKAIVTDLLKNRLGFKGLVVTDALDMAGLTRLYASNVGRAAVEAFKAGCDWLIIPADFEASYRALLEAVRGGEISRERLDSSVLKVLRLKASVGLSEARLVDIASIARAVGAPENVTRGQQIADDAVTLVRGGGMLPLKMMEAPAAGLPYLRTREIRNRVVLLVLSDDLRSESGGTLERQLRARVPDLNAIFSDPRTVSAISDRVLKAVGEAQVVVLAAYLVPTAGGLTDTTALSDATVSLFRQILDRAADRILVLAMGNPYVAQAFPDIRNYLCSFSTAPVSETAVVSALFGEIPIRGRLPVTIPGIAARGAGMDRPAAR
jgi:beta-N-acetylhexosaminidase